ncbi:MAG: branched-chain amino acid ABC transporter permease, partial [Synergistaceae bacterium]|nr:branched-chain amino acid ABC transporter permease [Synergistaceae bacterium]
MFLQTLVTGLSIGSVYSLMAVGYSLIFSILSFSNFAHGAVIMLGAYIGFALASKLSLGLGLVVTGSVVGAGLISVFNERVAYSALRRRHAPSLYLMISAMGCSMFLENMVYATIGSRFYSFPEFFKRQVIQVGGSSLSLLDLFAFIVSMGAIFALHLFITRTKTGIAIRAGVNDMTMCS